MVIDMFCLIITPIKFVSTANFINNDLIFFQILTKNIK